MITARGGTEGGRRRQAVMVLAALITVLGAQLSAQGQEGNPLHDFYSTLQVSGQMVLDDCRPGVGSGRFNGIVIPLGSLTPGGPVCWIVGRGRCDVSARSTDLLLYRGVSGGLPAVESGERIGITDSSAQVEFLAAGDFDNSGYKDLVAGVRLLNDTSFGNVDDSGRTANSSIGRVIVFWADGSGHYSSSDTTHLSNGVGGWAGPHLAASVDMDRDGIDDLILGPSSGYAQGKIVKTPWLQIFRGSDGGRWGAEEISRRAYWHWWNVPDVNKLSILDQDCDGVYDIVLYENAFVGGTGFIRILYGTSSSLPDTNDLQTADLLIANGHGSLLSDVTGDKIPELLLTCGSEQRIKIFAGKPGQRIIEQYGDGYDSLDRVNKRYPLRPWAEIWMPSRINKYWNESGDGLWNLGDINGDGISEIWSGSWPYLTGYGGGERLDSVVDVVYRRSGNGSFTRLGDIDGSGVPSIAMAYSTGVTVQMLKPGDDIPSTGRFRQLPHVKGFRCSTTLGVDQDGGTDNLEMRGLGLVVVPNPSHGDVQVSWHPWTASIEAVITIHDVLGRQVFEIITPASGGHAEWSMGDYVGGVYYITVQIGRITETTRITLQ